MIFSILLSSYLCAPPVNVVHGDVQDNFAGDSITWHDAHGKPRSAFLVENGRQDPTGAWGGYVRTFTYEAHGKLRVCSGTDPDYPGFGSVVNHYGSTSSDTFREAGGTTHFVFEGKHHVIVADEWTYQIDGQEVHVTVHWLFATGHSNPIYAITYDLTKAPVDSVCADTRAPYGDVAWDGGAGVDVDGVAWGDHYRFTTLQSPVTMQTGWNYKKTNTIPFVQAWSHAADAEMGMVQTLDMNAHDAGGGEFYPARGTENAAGPMPQASDWPYQIDQYQIPYTLAAKRIAWGTNYGAVGQSAYPSFGDDRSLSGYPYQSYSVYVVLGQHSRHEVETQVEAVEAVYHTAVEALHGGVVASSGSAGVGRDDRRTLEPKGYDATYGTWDAWAEDCAKPLALKFKIADGHSLRNPIIRVHHWHVDPSSELTLRLDNQKLVENKDFFVSYDRGRSELWITIDRKLDDAANVEISVKN